MRPANEPREERTAKLFNNHDRTIGYRRASGAIKPQFLYEFVLFSYAGTIDPSVTSGSLAENRETPPLNLLSAALKEADRLHYDSDTLFLLQREFSRLSKKAKSEHADIFRGNKALQAALGFIELTLCQETMLNAEYSRHAFFDKAYFIFNEPELAIEEQPVAPESEAQENQNEAVINYTESRPSICTNFLNAMLCCIGNIAASCRRPSARIVPAHDFNNPIFRTEREGVAQRS